MAEYIACGRKNGGKNIADMSVWTQVDECGGENAPYTCTL